MAVEFSRVDAEKKQEGWCDDNRNQKKKNPARTTVVLGPLRGRLIGAQPLPCGVVRPPRGHHHGQDDDVDADAGEVVGEHGQEEEERGEDADVAHRVGWVGGRLPAVAGREGKMNAYPTNIGIR